MKTFNKLSAALALAALAALGSSAQAAGSLVLTPAAGSVQVSNTFSVQVRGDSFSDIVGGGGFDLSFNPAVLQLESVTINAALWEFDPRAGAINNAAGTLTTASFATFVASPTGSFLAATLNFTAKAEGVSAMTLAASSLAVFATSAGDPITVNFGSGSMAVTPVPEPTTWASMAFGLALMPMLLSRRRRRALA